MRNPIILVVDDDEPILGLMRNLLREFKFDALIASSGVAALERARETPPDLVLLDLNMPGMSGPEAIQAFRAEEKLREVPILILSGEPVSPQELASIGAQGAVQKPFDLPVLIEQIRSSLRPVDAAG